MQKMKVAFVTSTLPARYLYDNIELLNIHKVICANKEILESYKWIEEKFSNTKLESLSKNFILRYYYLFKDIKNNEVFFFHECCWILFDIFLILLKPKSNFLPQVSLDSFTKINSENLIFSKLIFNKDVNNSIVKRLLKTIIILKIKNYFNFYTDTNDGGENKYIFSSLQTEQFNWIKNYGLLNKKSISSKPKFLKTKEFENIYAKKALLVLAREHFNDAIQIKIYSKLIEILKENSFIVYIKNHPRLNTRLKFSPNLDTIELLPALPLELLDMDFDLVFGMASTSLIHFKEKAISLLNLVEMNEEILGLRKKHLVALENEELLIKFPNSFSDIIELINSKFPINET